MKYHRRSLCTTPHVPQLLGDRHAQGRHECPVRQASLPLTPRSTLPLQLWLSVRLSRHITRACAGVAEPGTHLQVGHGLGEAQGVKAAVAGERAVQPLGARGVGQPQRVACASGRTLSAPLAAGADRCTHAASQGACFWAGTACPHVHATNAANWSALHAHGSSDRLSRRCRSCKLTSKQAGATPAWTGSYLT